MLTCNNITKVFQHGSQTTKAVSGATLEFCKGIHMIEGWSGSGKTTLLRMLGGLCQPDAGEVCLDGKSLYALSEDEQAEVRSKEFSFIFQFFQLIPEFRVYDNMALPLYICNRRQNEDKIHQIAQDLMIENLLGRMPAELSGGQKQRVAIGRSLVSGADYIFADEPTGNLDKETGIKIMNIFERLKKEKTIIMVTHDLELLKYADVTYRMEDGVIRSYE